MLAGQTRLSFSQLGTAADAAKPGRFFFGAGPAPSSTTDPESGKVYDAVMYVDSSDGKFKVMKKDGTITVLA